MSATRFAVEHFNKYVLHFIMVLALCSLTVCKLKGLKTVKTGLHKWSSDSEFLNYK